MVIGPEGERRRNQPDEHIERIDELNIIVRRKDINKIDWAELNTWLQMYKSYCMDCHMISS